MALANFCNVTSFGGFFLFPLFVSNHGGSEADIGIIMGAFSLSSVLCRPWISEMVDRIGRQRSYTIGCLSMSFLPLTYLLLQGDLESFYLSLILIRLLHGIGLAICFTAVFTYVADIVPEARLNEGLGTFGITGIIGMAVGPLVAEGIINTFGFSFFFLAAAGIAALGFLLQLTIPESYVPAPHAVNQSFFSVLFRRKILAVSLLAGLFGFGLAASSSFVAPFAKEQHLGFISFYYLSYSAAAVVARILGGRLADRIGEGRIIPYAFLVTGAGLLLMTCLGGSEVLVLSGLLSGCGHGFLFPCLNSLVVRNEPVAIRGKITGVFTGGFDTGTFVGCIVLGYIGEWVGFRMLFLVAGVAIITGLAAYRVQRNNAEVSE